MKNKKYCWRRDHHDERDYMLGRPNGRPIQIHVDLRNKCPPVYDQGDMGSCTANAICASFQYICIREGKQVFFPSRLFLYYNERSIEGTVGEDSGASLRDGLKSIATQGVCSESLWPYDRSKLTTKPSPICYDTAKNHNALQYQRLYQRIEDLEACLTWGIPFVFGITLYDSFESDAVARTGKVPMPDTSSENMLGGHAVMAVGYDRPSKQLICRNSWGAAWGDKGYFYLPYAYAIDRNLAGDFWCIQVV